MGGAGMLASSFAQPVIGKKYDQVTNERALAIVKESKDPVITTSFAAYKASMPEPEAASKTLSEAAGKIWSTGDTKAAWASAQADGGSAGLQQLVVLPGILIVIFGGIFLSDKAKGGYKKEALVQDQA